MLGSRTARCKHRSMRDLLFADSSKTAEAVLAARITVCNGVSSEPNVPKDDREPTDSHEREPVFAE